MSGRPYIAARVSFEFSCKLCGRSEQSRVPYNPMQVLPDVVAALPNGWMLMLDGDNPQTPVALCGCAGREAA